MLATWGTSTGFNPASLFAGGEQGAWYDPSDNTTMYTSSLAEVGVTSVETGVGLILDKSKGLVIGSDASNGVWLNTFTTTFDTFTSTSSSGFTGTTTGAKSPRVRLPINFVASTWYWIEFTISLTNATASVTMGTDAYGGVGIQPASVSTSGTYRILNTGTATTSAMFSITATGAATVVVSNFTIRPLPGNHAYQTTSASRPTLRARYNLLTYSEELNDASWVKSNSSITQDSTTAPNGTLTADTLVENTATNIHAVTSISVTFAASSQHRLSVYAKPSGRNWILIQFPTVPFGATTRAWFDVSTGTVGTRENCTGSISNEGNGWFRCTITATTTVGGAGTSAFYTSTGDGLSSYTGDGTSGLFLWGAQIVPTAVFPSNTYQRIAAATDYATGAAFPQYLAFDGTDDSLLTANVDFATVTSDGQARRNLLLNPTQLDASTWTKTNTTVTANAATAPDSTLTADEVVNTTAIPSVFQNAGTLGTGVYTASCYLKKSTARYGYIILVIGSSRYSVLIDLDNGQFVNDYNTTTPLTSKGYQIQSVGDGWYRLSVTGANVSGGTGFVVIEDSDTAAISVNSNLDITNATIGSKIFAWGAQLETGSTATAFQNIGTDKMTVWSGLSKLSDAATAMIVELSASLSTNNGSFYFIGPTGAAGNNYQYVSKGTVNDSGTSGATFASPITNVVTGQSDIGAPSVSLRVNGTLAQARTATQGTGNFLAYPLFIGRRNNASLPFNGRIYSLIVRGAASNTTQVAQTEKWVANKTPLGTV